MYRVPLNAPALHFCGVPFLCPSCTGPRLEITTALELPSDSFWDELTLQVLTCSACGFAGTAIYEESRRGALDSECINHLGYSCPPDDVRRIQNLIEQCPDPTISSCTCAAHQVLGKTVDGRWTPPPSVLSSHSFTLRFANA